MITFSHASIVPITVTRQLRKLTVWVVNSGSSTFSRSGGLLKAVVACVLVSIAAGRAGAAATISGADVALDLEVDITSETGVAIGGDESVEPDGDGGAPLGLHLTFGDLAALSETHRQRFASDVQKLVLNRIDQHDGAALDESVDAVLFDRAGVTVIFTEGSVSDATITAVAQGVVTAPLTVKLTRTQRLVSTAAEVWSAAAVQALVASAGASHRAVRVKRQSGLVTTTTNAPQVTGGTIAVTFPLAGASVVDQATLLTAVRQRAIDNGATLENVDVVASATDVVVTLTFGASESASSISAAATAMDPVTAPITVALPSGGTTTGTIVIVTLTGGSPLSLTRGPTPAPTVPTCSGVPDDVVCPTIVGGLGCVGVLPQVCPATCGACGGSAATTAPSSSAPTGAPTSAAPTTAAPTSTATCFGVTDPVSCLTLNCNDDTTKHACPLKCSTCFGCNGVSDSVVCRLSLADCASPGIAPICPGKCGQPQCTTTTAAPVAPTDGATSAVVVNTPDPSDPCAAVDANSVASSTSASFCDCNPGFVDEAKPTNSRIHIKAIGTFNTNRGCTHRCSAAQPASELCYCVANPGTAGCVDQAVTAAPVGAPTQTSAPVVAVTAAPATAAPTAFGGDACSQIDPNSRLSATNSNYCACIPGFVDGAKPSNSQIHINAIGSFNANRGCTHVCTATQPASQICFCQSNPSGAGCT